MKDHFQLLVFFIIHEKFHFLLQLAKQLEKEQLKLELRREINLIIFH